MVGAWLVGIDKVCITSVYWLYEPRDTALYVCVDVSRGNGNERSEYETLATL